MAKSRMRSLTIPIFVRLLVVAGFVATAGFAAACETPVYRYAMYRWQPAPYEIYCFHKESLGDGYADVKSAIEEVTGGSDQANMVLLPVDVSADPELLGVPADVKQAWESGSEQSLPGYLVSTPYGVALHQGPLTAAEVNELADSPARKSLAAQLETGKIGVFIFLASSDAEANSEARETIKGLLAEVADGNVNLYTPPGSEASDADDQQPAAELGWIEVDRASQQEHWLVKSLLTVEPDLQEDDQPMAFLVYGRGRTLLPYIGKGISRENLLREVEFISGACSCTVKEQNPGVDLLVRYDWESAAAALAERVGAEEGNETSFGADMFFPELIIPSSNQADASGAPDGGAALAAAAAGEESDAAGGLALVDGEAESVRTAVVSGELDSGDGASEGTTAAVPATPPMSSELASTGAAAESEASQPATLQASSRTTFGVVAIGLAVALIALFGVTLVVLRPQ